MKSKIFLIDDSLAEPIFINEAIEQTKVNIDLEAFNESKKAIEELKLRAANNNGTIPKLILLDLNMPGDSGLDILKILRNEEKLRLIPVVVLTSSNLLKDIKECILAGARSVIVKPRSIDEYKTVIVNIHKYWFETVKLDDFE